MPRTLQIITPLLCLLPLTTGIARASINLIQDSGFEFVDLSGVPIGNYRTAFSGAFGAWEVVVPDTSNTFASVDIWNDPTWLQESPQVAGVGGAVIDLNGNSPGALHQTVTVSPGQFYQFALHQFNNGLGLRVVLEDSLAGVVFDHAYSGSLDPGFGEVVGTVPSNGATWERLATSYVASGTELLVRIESIDIDPSNVGGAGPYVGGFVDAVSLTALPEPGSHLVWLTLGTVISAFSGCRCRNGAFPPRHGDDAL